MRFFVGLAGLGVLAVAASVGACSSGDDTSKATTTTASSVTSSDASSGVGAGGSGAGGGSTSTSASTGAGGCVDTDALPLLDTPPDTLSGTGLLVNGSLAPYVRHFVPEYKLWSDGATKERWAYIPKCTQIDTSDMDHWQMPIGSRFWKQFTRDGILVETRFIHRYGPAQSNWIFAAYQWDPNKPDADPVHVPMGVPDANGTQHDIPPEAMCTNCHAKLDERVLGFSAIQLSLVPAANDVSIGTLSAEGLLTVPAPQGFDPPGDAVAQAALGYLHANCGNCHNDAGKIPVDLRMRLLVGQTTVQTTDTYTSGVGKKTTNFACNGCSRIEAGDAAGSAVIQRMSARGTPAQMPPIATEIVDQPGIDAVSAWIDSLAVCGSAGDACSDAAACCNGSCVGQICVDACTATGQACGGGGECCTGVCTANLCVCSGDFQPCAQDSDCCGNVTCDKANGFCL